MSRREVVVGRWCSRMCSHCNSEVGLYVEGVQFESRQARQNLKPSGRQSTAKTGGGRRVGASLQLGQPLPLLGTCKHYRLSHRHGIMSPPLLGVPFPAMGFVTFSSTPDNASIGNQEPRITPPCRGKRKEYN